MISRELSGTVFNVQRYSLQDGPGIRTTVFLKGCPLCCAWCHNPEGISPRTERVVVETRCLTCGECRKACEFGSTTPGSVALPPRVDACTDCGACVEACPTGARQALGESMTVTEVVREAARDRVFYDDSRGGVTVSGGEPLSQPNFLVALLERLASEGFHTALDTTGFGCTEHLLAAARHARLVLYDLKAFDDDRHRRLTGVSNRGILRNLLALDAAQGQIWIRLPIVPGFTDDRGELEAIAEFVAPLGSVRRVSLLPFHRTGLHKYERLGRVHDLTGVETPTAARMEQTAAIFRARGLVVQIGG